MAKGQLRSNREKKKPKAEKNKKKSASVPSVFERVRTIGKGASAPESRGEKSAATSSLGAIVSIGRGAPVRML